MIVCVAATGLMSKLRFSGKREAEDMNLPAYRLHPLKGEYEGYYSVAVNGNWRIVFCFESETPKDVDLGGLSLKGNFITVKTPSHPGSLVREDCINELGLTVTLAAGRLGVTRQTLSNLINEKSALTPETAIRLERVGWGTADLWIRMQANYDLARARAYEHEIVMPNQQAG